MNFPRMNIPMLIDTPTLLTAGIGTLFVLGFGIQPTDKAFMTFSLIVAEEITRKKIVPMLTNSMRADNGLLVQTQHTVRRPSNADTQAFGMRF